MDNNLTSPSPNLGEQVLSMIGEGLEDEGDLCGATVSTRRTEYRVSVWSQTADNKDLQVNHHTRR